MHLGCGLEIKVQLVYTYPNEWFSHSHAGFSSGPFAVTVVCAATLGCYQYLGSLFQVSMGKSV